jgi:hypothetical protein
VKCPICENEVQEYNDYYTEHILCEQIAKCEDEHHYYSYEFDYGISKQRIGGITFRSYHGDSLDLKNLQNEQYKAVLKLEKENYKKRRFG